MNILYIIVYSTVLYSYSNTLIFNTKIALGSSITYYSTCTFDTESTSECDTTSNFRCPSLNLLKNANSEKKKVMSLPAVEFTGTVYKKLKQKK